MIKISAPNRLRIAAMERLIGVGPSCVVDDVSPHHRQTQSLWEASTGWRCGVVPAVAGRTARVVLTNRSLTCPGVFEIVDRSWNSIREYGVDGLALPRPGP